jgi:hypothetical protein
MYRSIKISYLFTLFFLFSGQYIHGQYIPTHISNTGIYEFLDELATLQVIDINTSIKPYSRTLINEKLEEASKQQDHLTRRQIQELNFYLKDYSKKKSVGSGQLAGSSGQEAVGSGQWAVSSEQRNSNWLWIKKPASQRLDFFHYKDSSFNLTVNPILGSNVWSNENGSFYHWWNGIETYASKGNFALFASLRDNHESVYLTNRNFMNQRIGLSNYKGFSGTTKRDYWEIRAGMTYAWDWGRIGLLMDQFSWGDNANGANVFSGRTPAFTRLDLQLDPVDWLSFNYVHGWLISEVVDSTLSFWVNNAYGSDYREVYQPKYMAANMFTFKPFKHFYIGVGNSVIYDYRSPHAAFFIPVMFWKPLDHTLSARINNMNSQMFFTLSSRNLRGFHFYGSAFIDEVQVGRIFREGEYNFTSYKIGANSQLSPLISLLFEYTWSNALVFRHNVTTTTFESNEYNLGHFLEDNARDIYAAIEFKPIRTMKITGYYNYSEKGPDHTLLGTMPRTTMTPISPVVWESSRIGIKTSIQIINDMYLRVGYEWREVGGEEEYVEMWTPEVYWGKTGTWKVGLNYGF